MSSVQVTIIQEVEDALAAEREASIKRSEEQVKAASQERDKMSRVGGFLRFVGVSVLVVAMGVFMFQRWEEMTQMSRYFTFLAFTAGVCVAGLVCGLKIQENKGARTLLGTVALLLPLHCAQIGAFLYSRLGHGVNPTDYPSYFLLSVPSLSDALIVAGVGLSALIPMAYVAYSVLARNYARPLLLLGLGVSVALVIPTRDPLYVAGLLAIAGCMTFLGERKFSSIVELKTREALVARSVPILALAIMVGRQSALYHPTGFFRGVVFGMVSAGLFGLVAKLSTHRAITWLAEAVSFMTMTQAVFLIADGVVSGFELSHTTLAPLFFGLPLTVLYGVLAPRARETGAFFRASSGAALVMTGVCELSGQTGVEGSVVALIIGIVGTTVACISESKSLLFAGMTLVTFALIKVCGLAISSLTVSLWVTLGVIGVGTILGGSYLERNYVRLREGLSSIRKEVASWK